MPEISICIQCHNAEDDIAKCLDSVLKQSFRDIEVLVQVGEGADKDKMWEIVDGYAKKDSRVKPERGEGVAGLNALISHASGKYYAFPSPYTRWNILFLERCYSFLHAYTTEMAGTNWDYLRKGKRVGRKCHSREKIYYDYRRELIHRAPLSMSAMLVSRKALEAVLPFQDAADYELWIGASKAGYSTYYSKERLAYLNGVIHKERQEAVVLAKHGRELRRLCGWKYPLAILRRIGGWLGRCLTTHRIDFRQLLILLGQLAKSFIPGL